jgi:hypothetical protein
LPLAFLILDTALSVLDLLNKVVDAHVNIILFLSKKSLDELFTIVLCNGSNRFEEVPHQPQFERYLHTILSILILKALQDIIYVTKDELIVLKTLQRFNIVFVGKQPSFAFFCEPLHKLNSRDKILDIIFVKFIFKAGSELLQFVCQFDLTKHS